MSIEGLVSTPCLERKGWPEADGDASGVNPRMFSFGYGGTHQVSGLESQKRLGPGLVPDRKAVPVQSGALPLAVAHGHDPQWPMFRLEPDRGPAFPCASRIGPVGFRVALP